MIGKTLDSYPSVIRETEGGRRETGSSDLSPGGVKYSCRPVAQTKNCVLSF